MEQVLLSGWLACVLMGPWTLSLLLHESVIGTVFEGNILGPARVGGYRAVIPDLWDCLYDRDISGNSEAGRSVEI